MNVQRFELHPWGSMPRMDGADSLTTEQMVVGQWSLTAAAWTDRHQHEEINYVIEGELHVTCDDTTEVVGAGSVVAVAAGARARYAAPVYARMLFVYGPSSDGHGTSDFSYEELDATGPTATAVNPATGA